MSSPCAGLGAKPRDLFTPVIRCVLLLAAIGAVLVSQARSYSAPSCAVSCSVSGHPSAGGRLVSNRHSSSKAAVILHRARVAHGRDVVLGLPHHPSAERFGGLPRAIVATVVDDDDLGRLPEAAESAGDVTKGLRQTTLFIVGGDDDRESHRQLQAAVLAANAWTVQSYLAARRAIGIDAATVSQVSRAE
jgi:hypothetical protein